MPKYPHMSPGEAKLWDRYLAWSPHRFLTLTYDLHLGDSAPLDPSWEPWLVNLVMATSRKRVDVIGETEKEIIIYEIKEYAGMGALGQLLCYEALYREEYKPTKSIRKTVITDRLPPNMATIFPQFNIEVILV